MHDEQEVLSGSSVLAVRPVLVFLEDHGSCEEYVIGRQRVREVGESTIWLDSRRSRPRGVSR